VPQFDSINDSLDRAMGHLDDLSIARRPSLKLPIGQETQFAAAAEELKKDFIFASFVSNKYS
jgi:hypothetical protein